MQRLLVPMIYTPAENIQVRDFVSFPGRLDVVLYVKSKGTDNGYRITFECITVDTDYDETRILDPHMPVMIWASFDYPDGAILLPKKEFQRV